MVFPAPLLLVQLDFKDSVALRPPKEFETTWKAYNHGLWRGELPYSGDYLRFNWAHDDKHPHTVKVIIEWDESFLLQYPWCDCQGKCRNRCKEKHVIGKIESSVAFEFIEKIIPYLRNPPRTTLVLGDVVGKPESIGGTKTDVFTIEVPLGSAIHVEALTAIQLIHGKCRDITDLVFCCGRGAGRGWLQERGDMMSCTLGMQELSGVCTFILLIAWTSTERELRFKDPEQPSMASQRRRLKQEWWETQVIHPLNDLSTTEAKVTFESIYLHQSQRDWPFKPLAEDVSLDLKTPLEEDWQFERSCFGMKRRERSCTIL